MTIQQEVPHQAGKNIFRFGCMFLAFELLALAAGIDIWLITHGIYLFISRLILYWKPARLWASNILHNQDEKYLVMPNMTWYRYIYLAIYLTVAIGFIYFGASSFFHQGFLDQNLIYGILTRK